jgi:hypothetical protein
MSRRWQLGRSHRSTLNGLPRHLAQPGDSTTNTHPAGHPRIAAGHYRVIFEDLDADVDRSAVGRATGHHALSGERPIRELPSTGAGEAPAMVPV